MKTVLFAGVRWRLSTLRKSAHPELAAVAVECIEESKQPDVAERYDYYYVPTFYIDGRKVHEGSIAPDEVEAVLRMVLD